MYSFYLASVLIARRGWLRTAPPRNILALAAIASFVLVLLTYNLNNGPFRLHVAAVKTQLKSTTIRSGQSNAEASADAG
nr:hypothetical protein [uncultured Lichenicoccus sp.]